MCAYRFHCTNGAALVIDRKGHQVENGSDLRTRAAEVALDVLVNYPASELEDWVVTIQDEDGRQHGAITFDELLDVACGRGDVLATFRHGHEEALIHGA